MFKRKSILFLIILLFSCSISGINYYPEGKVEIIYYKVYDNLSTRYCNVYYKISNTGLSKISLSTISIKVKTDISEYYKTIVNNTPIQISNIIFGDILFTFITNTEIVSNISVENSFFE